jgi:hypothetical protein
MKARFILTPIVLMVALSIILSSCTDAVNKLATAAVNHQFQFEREDSVKWGKLVERTCNLPDFTALDVDGVICLVYTQDSVCSVRIRGNEKCLEAYNVGMNEDELKVSLKERNGKINDNTPAIILYVSAPVLKEVEFSGGGKVEMRGQIEMPGKLAVELNGATNFVADSMAVGSLELETNGASKCSIAKLETIGNVEIEVNGAGDIDVNVFCQDLRIEMNGAGKGTFSGECKKLVCEENGASKIDFSKLKR